MNSVLGNTYTLGPLTVLILVLIGMFAGLMLLLSALKLRTADAKRLKNWSLMALVFAIISNIGAILNLGFIIALVGGILGYWYSRKTLSKAPIIPFILVLIGGLIVIFVNLVPLLFIFGFF